MDVGTVTAPDQPSSITRAPTRGAIRNGRRIPLALAGDSACARSSSQPLSGVNSRRSVPPESGRSSSRLLPGKDWSPLEPPLPTPALRLKSQKPATSSFVSLRARRDRPLGRKTGRAPFELGWSPHGENHARLAQIRVFPQSRRGAPSGRTQPPSYVRLTAPNRIRFLLFPRQRLPTPDRADRSLFQVEGGGGPNGPRF